MPTWLIYILATMVVMEVTSRGLPMHKRLRAPPAYDDGEEEKTNSDGADIQGQCTDCMGCINHR